MTVTIPQGATFLGAPLIAVRNMLNAWNNDCTSDDAATIASRGDVNLDPRTVMILLDELRDRGLIGLEPPKFPGDPIVDGLTERGFALSSATAQKRISKKQAWIILEKFLANCAAINARRDVPFFVNEVWLFGSMIDDAKHDVGDIDFVAHQEPTDVVKRGEVDAEKMCIQLAKSLKMRAMQDDDYSGIVKRLLFGEMRNPRLAALTLDILKDMACPCQLVFNRTHGRVSDAILPKHPDAGEKKTNIREALLAMPDLSVGRKSLRPLPVELNWPPEAKQVLRRRHIGPWPEQSHAYRNLEQPLYQITKNCPYPTTTERNVMVRNKVINKLDFSDCDGRKRFGLVAAEHYTVDADGKRLIGSTFDLKWSEWKTAYRPTCGFVIDRSIRETTRKVEYRLGIVDAVAMKGDISQGISMIWYWLYFLATADIERIRLRDEEQNLSRELVVRVGNNDPILCDLPGVLRASLVRFRAENRLSCASVI